MKLIYFVTNSFYQFSGHLDEGIYKKLFRRRIPHAVAFLEGIRAEEFWNFSISKVLFSGSNALSTNSILNILTVLARFDALFIG